MASMLRLQYYMRIHEQIQEFESKSDSELDEICATYTSRNIFHKMLSMYPDGRADYEAAHAVKNMHYLGLEKAPLKKESVFGMMDALDYLENKTRYEKKKGSAKGQNLEHKLNPETRDEEGFFEPLGDMFIPAIYLNVAPYLLPSVIQYQSSPIDPDQVKTGDRGIRSFSSLLGVLILPAQIAMYVDNPSLLKALVAMNVLSGAYEIGRAIYEKHNQGGV